MLWLGIRGMLFLHVLRYDENVNLVDDVIQVRVGGQDAGEAGC